MNDNIKHNVLSFLTGILVAVAFWMYFRGPEILEMQKDLARYKRDYGLCLSLTRVYDHALDSCNVLCCNKPPKIPVTCIAECKNYTTAP